MNKAWLFAFVAATLGMAVAPAFANGMNCLFRGGGAALAFGTLDPSSATTVTVPVTLGSLQVGDCSPPSQTMTISADNGSNFSGGTRRLSNGSGSFIPYTITGLPLTMNKPGNNRYTTFTFNGTIAGTAYQDARAGLHQDTVIISVTP